MSAQRTRNLPEKKKTQNPSVKKKFSFNEQREYDTIEDTIARKEAEIEQTETDINNSVSDFVKLNELTQKKEQLESGAGSASGEVCVSHGAGGVI